MKRRCTGMLMMTGILVMSMPMAAYAQSANNVWIDEADIEYNEAEWKVEVMTDGKSSDGLLEISYNMSLLSVEEEDVHLSENVDMYSINVTEDGKVKIAYLAEETVEEGVMAEISFAVKGDSVTIDALELEGEIYDPDGKELNVGVILEEEDAQKPVKPEDGESETETEETKNPTQQTDTGDSNHVGLWAAIMTAALGTISGIVIKKRKQRGI